MTCSGITGNKSLCRYFFFSCTLYCMTNIGSTSNPWSKAAFVSSYQNSESLVSSYILEHFNNTNLTSGISQNNSFRCKRIHKQVITFVIPIHRKTPIKQRALFGYTVLMRVEDGLQSILDKNGMSYLLHISSVIFISANKSKKLYGHILINHLCAIQK